MIHIILHELGIIQKLTFVQYAVKKGITRPVQGPVGYYTNPSTEARMYVAGLLTQETLL